jgi:single-stranded-DNA-specific exonuclease
VTVAAVQIDALRDAFAAQAAAHAPAPTPEMVVDAELHLGECDQGVASQFQRLAPFGPGNAAPIVTAVGARVRETRRVGDGSHLKLTLECGRHATSHSAIAFRMGDRDPGPGATLDVAFCPGISQWRGQTRVELRVTEFRTSSGL